MKNENDYVFFPYIRQFLVIFLLTSSFSVQATAPRITAQLFGEERQSDIVSYQSSAAQADNLLVLEIVNEAFQAAGKSPVVDVLPAKQLAVYSFFNNDVAGLIGSPDDLAGKVKKQYRVVTLYMAGADEQPVVLIFSNQRGLALHKAFANGMQKIISSGKYQQLYEKYHYKLPVGFILRLKRQNPEWK